MSECTATRVPTDQAVCEAINNDVSAKVHIECIELGDSEDDTHHTDNDRSHHTDGSPPQKMPRLELKSAHASHAPHASLTSALSPLTPVTSLMTGTPCKSQIIDNNCDLNVNNQNGVISEAKVETSLQSSERIDRCVDQCVDECSDSSGKAGNTGSSGAQSGAQCATLCATVPRSTLSAITHSTHSHELSRTAISTDSKHIESDKHNHNNNDKIKSESKSHTNEQTVNESLIKRLIGVCVDKRFEAQSVSLNGEMVWIKRVKALKSESHNRNIELSLIKKCNKMKTPTVYCDKQTQMIWDEVSEEANSHLKVKRDINESSQTRVPSTHCSSDHQNKPNILKQHLQHKQLQHNNTNELSAKNGFVKLNTSETNVSNVSQKQCSVLTNNNRDHNDNDSDIITIDSDEEDKQVVNSEHLKPDLSAKTTKFNSSLPQPKLSVSFSKLNNVKRIGSEQLKSVTLKWTLTQEEINRKHKIIKYMIYMYRRESEAIPANTRPIGSVDALDPPMACTLSNLSKGKYHFYVRAFDTSLHMGPSSNVEAIDIL